MNNSWRDQHRSSVQPDETQLGLQRRGAASGHVGFNDVLRYLNAKNVPPQLRQTPYIAKLDAIGQPKLLIPANPNRMSFIVSYNGSDQIVFSYNFPVGIVNGLGITVVTGSFFQEGNGTVSIDDIYVYTNNMADLDTPILGYEGVLAVESHLHNQTR